MTSRQTESDAYEPTVQLHRWAQKWGGGGHRMQTLFDRGGHRFHTPSDMAGNRFHTPSNRRVIDSYPFFKGYIVNCWKSALCSKNFASSAWFFRMYTYKMYNLPIFLPPSSVPDRTNCLSSSHQRGHLLTINKPDVSVTWMCPWLFCSKTVGCRSLKFGTIVAHR